MKNIHDLLVKSQDSRILFIFPHFDDCAFVSSGFIQEAKRYGVETQVCVLSDSEDRIGFGEFQSYVSQLGIENAFVLKTTKSSLESSVTNLVTQLKPELVVTFDPGGVTGNSQHTLTSLKVYEALKRLKVRPMLLWRVADSEEEKYFGKTPRPLGREYSKVLKLSLGLKSSIRKIKAILSNKSKMKGILYKLRIIEWYLLDHQESYYLVDFANDRLKVNYN